jgi:predicted nucleic acid-binding protein
MMMVAKRAFVDTNVLLRATNAQFPLHREAKSLVDSCWTEGQELWISRQIIREFLVQVTRPQGTIPAMTVDQVNAQMSMILASFNIADETAAVTAQLLLLIREFPTGGKQVHDANIVATMLVNGIDRLLTQNVDDMKRFSDRITLVPLVPAL